jgi:hypothetical protein
MEKLSWTIQETQNKLAQAKVKVKNQHKANQTMDKNLDNLGKQGKQNNQVRVKQAKNLVNLLILIRDNLG